MEPSIPKEWDVVDLATVCNRRNELIHPSSDTDARFVGLEHIASGETKITKHSQDTALKSSKFRFRDGDMLYGKLRPYLDKAAVADFDGICSTDLLVLVPDGNKILKDFLAYVLHSKEFLRHAVSTTSGTNHPRTSWAAISKFRFGLPALAEQKRIVEVLGVVDLAIQKTDKVVAKTERLKKGLMQKLLTEGIGHEEFKDTEIGRVPTTWEVVRLGGVAELQSGGTPSRQEPKYWNGNVPWLKSGELNDAEVYDTEEKITESGLRESAAKIFTKGTLLIALYGKGTVSKTTILGIDASTNQAIGAIIPKEDRFAPKFLQHCLIFLREKLLNQLVNPSSDVGRTNIYLGTLKLFKIPLPPVNEQKAIAQILSMVDSKLEFERKEKAKLERVKRGLMDLLLTGKVRTKVD